MKASRRTQPYRKGMPRAPGPAMQAMIRGKPLGMPNPADRKRAAQRAGRRKPLARRLGRL